MTRIDTTTGLAAAIRRQVTSLARTSKTAPTASADTSTRTSGRAASGTAGDVAELVARRVQAIDPNDPGRKRKAFRVFLESVLLAELGEESLINDAGFYRLVDDVHVQMEGDADLVKSMDLASAWLLDGKLSSAAKR